MITSLDDLTAHVDRQGFGNLQQQRVLSLSGLMPSDPPGTIYRYHGDRSPFTAIGISTDRDSDCGETKSYYIERTVSTDATLPELVAIRTALIETNVLASELIRLRLERLTLSKDADASMRMAASDAVASKQIAFNSSVNRSTAMLNTPGIMVVRASTRDASSWAAKLGNVLGLSRENQKETSGFAVLAGLRTTRLFLGTDIKQNLELIKHDWTLIGRKFPFVVGASWIEIGGMSFPIIHPGQISRDNFYVPTSSLQAKFVLFGQDSVSEARIQANIVASIDQIKEAKTLLATEEASIDLILSTIASLGSSGILGPVTERRVCTHTTPTDDRESWTPIYSVLTELDDLDSLANGNPRVHLGFW